jgi:NAD(P)-dependent dehydrogenase (short-subunit alcohol dehydrogenase family)
MTDRSKFGADTTTDEVLEGIDLSGKVAIITGSSGGLGAEAARALASKGAAVTITARDVPKGESVAESIRSSTGNAAVEVRALELGSPESIRQFAKGWLAEHDALNILINNAGVMASPLARTEAGYELQLGTNHLGHFLLTGLLTPALIAGGPARVVCVSSGGHRFSPVVFEDLNYESRAYDKWESYGQAKTANILHAVELDRRLRDKGVRGYAIHPGGIMTELGRHLDADDIKMLTERSASSGLTWKEIPAGAATEVYAATAPELDGKGAVYLEDCAIAEVSEDMEASAGVRAYALDAGNARRLWQMSEELVGERFAS